ncbi:MAG: endonuclease [Planctomycetota bacterium]
MRAWLLPILLTTATAVAQPPGYYSSVNTTNSTTIRSTLHAVIDDHTKLPYTGSFPDTWDVLERAYEDPSNSSRIVDVYRNQSIAKSQRGSGYNREHLWPSSYGFPNDNASNYPFSDCFLLALSTPAYNSARSNKPFDVCNPGCSEFATLATNGAGGGSGTFPGNSNWTEGSFTSGSWQVWGDRRGDVARAMFYVDVRYEGGFHGITGVQEPQLVLTDNRSLLNSVSSNQTLAYMGLLSVLLQWHYADPVDATEIARHNLIAAFQGNRNPFVDHPEWVDIAYNSSPPVPMTPGQFTAYGAGCGVMGLPAPVYFPAGSPNIDTTISLLLTGGPANSPAALTFGLAPASIPLDAVGFPGCTSLVQSFGSADLLTNQFGLSTLSLPIPDDNSLVGTSLFTQWLVLDIANIGLATSVGFEIEFGNL